MQRVDLTERLQVAGGTFYPGVAIVSDDVATALEDAGGSPLGAFDPTVNTVIYVDPANGDDGNTGASQDAALATIQAANELASPGDTIVLGTGTYSENADFTKDYLTVIGARTGYGRPDIAPAAGVAVTISGQGIVCRQLRGASEDDDAWRIKGNGFDVQDCVMDGAGTADKGGVRFKGHDTDDSYTASEGLLKGNLIRGNAIGVIFDTAEAAVGVGSTHNLLEDNRFIGNTVDMGTADTGPGTYSVQDVLISRNFFMDKNKAVYIDMTTANGGAAGDQSGTIADNFFNADALDDTRVKITGTGFGLVGNRTTVGIADGSGLD